MTVDNAINALNSINSNSVSTDSISTNLARVDSYPTINSINISADAITIKNDQSLTCSDQGLTWVTSSWEALATDSTWNNYWLRDRNYYMEPSYTIPSSIINKSTIATIEECFTIDYFKNKLNDLNKLFKKYNINIIFKYEDKDSKNNLSPNEYKILLEYITQLINSIAQNNPTSKDDLKQVYEIIKIANYFANEFVE